MTTFLIITFRRILAALPSEPFSLEIFIRSWNKFETAKYPTNQMQVKILLPTAESYENDLKFTYQI